MNEPEHELVRGLSANDGIPVYRVAAELQKLMDERDGLVAALAACQRRCEAADELVRQLRQWVPQYSNEADAAQWQAFDAILNHYEAKP